VEQLDRRDQQRHGQALLAGRAGLNTPEPIRRGLIAFDLSPILPGSQVLSVELRLHMSRTNFGAPAIPVGLHRVLQDWGEGESQAIGNEGTGAPATASDATWLHRFYPDIFWSQPGGDFVSAASATRIIDGIGFYSFASTPALVADVQAWVDDPASSFGWLLKTSETTSFTSKRFDTKENFDIALRPELIVSFHAPARSLRFGQGCSVGPAAPLDLEASGLPALGNAAFGLDLSGGPASGGAFLYLAFARNDPPYPLSPDCFLYLDIHSAAAAVQSGISPIGPLLLDASGARHCSLPVPQDPTVLGLGVIFQALALDSAATAGFRTSNGVELWIGL